MQQQQTETGTIGRAAAALAELDAEIAPIQRKMDELRAERDERQAVLDAATLDDDPLTLAAAQIRRDLLTKAITALAQELDPRLKRAQRDREEHDKLVRTADEQRRDLMALADLNDPHTQQLTVGHWQTRQRFSRDYLKQLTGEEVAA